MLGELLHRFNAEFDFPTPGTEAVARRVRALIDEDAGTFLLVGTPPVGVAAVRFREAIFNDKLDAYLEEFYVAPDHRGRGLGRALLEQVVKVARDRGAAWVALTTAEDDVVARHLYESLGFNNQERPGDPSTTMYSYELEL